MTEWQELSGAQFRAKEQNRHDNRHCPCGYHHLRFVMFFLKDFCDRRRCGGDRRGLNASAFGSSAEATARRCGCNFFKRGALGRRWNVHFELDFASVSNSFHSFRSCPVHFISSLNFRTRFVRFELVSAVFNLFHLIQI